ncbi:MAG: pyridoxal phosphate-dependent aminotransferase [candidate division Zixibacteria bacterium]|nr:pyridoxal phosphate-dependent aminotransferase [candidate division Zixibacteria bacterium]
MIKKVLIDRANRLYQMPPDLLTFAGSSEDRTFLRRADLLDLARFTWPLPCTSDHNITPESAMPASSAEIAELKNLVTDWFQNYHQTRISPEKEIFIGGGISSLVFLLSLAFLDRGDVAFVPGLGIPLYRSAVTASNAEPIGYEISAKNSWMPLFDRLSSRLGGVARLLFLNSPHNPTGAEFDEKSFAELIWLAGRENIMLVNDAAYASVASRKPVSLMAVRGGKRVGIELHSFSYSFGLPRLPFGFAVGSRDVISGIEQASRLLPSAIPKYFVDMASRAVRQFPNADLKKVRDQINRTRAAASTFLDKADLELNGYPTTPFAWAGIARRGLSVRMARQLFRRHRTLIIPGASFGETGEGFVRLCLCAGPEKFQQATERLSKRRLVRGDTRK